jgi:hypothetical protein
MNIIKATYGGVDCTAVVKSKIRNGSLVLRSDNNIIGDPHVGRIKSLIVNIDGKEYTTEEGNMFVYPKTQNKKLGIFYSNNNNSREFPAIPMSLKTIEKAAKGKADILTCVWNSIPGNPFIEYVAWTKTSSHLNQLLQILQLLYNAQEINDYETVSFLEHDVLYPEDYFDYPHIISGTVITNMNYIGLIKDGWQEVPVKHEPFHQMTMRFDEAIKHCESILKNALITNSGLIEPQIPNIKREKWECKNSSVHVNHGGHFTSHFSIYSSTNLKKIDPYWGNSDDYLHLFKT